MVVTICQPIYGCLNVLVYHRQSLTRASYNYLGSTLPFSIGNLSGRQNSNIQSGLADSQVGSSCAVLQVEEILAEDSDASDEDERVVISTEQAGDDNIIRGQTPAAAASALEEKEEENPMARSTTTPFEVSNSSTYYCPRQRRSPSICRSWEYIRLLKERKKKRVFLYTLKYSPAQINEMG